MFSIFTLKSYGLFGQKIPIFFLFAPVLIKSQGKKARSVRALQMLTTTYRPRSKSLSSQLQIPST